jgi:hypothetical protein
MVALFVFSACAEGTATSETNLDVDAGVETAQTDVQKAAVVTVKVVTDKRGRKWTCDKFSKASQAQAEAGTLVNGMPVANEIVDTNIKPLPEMSRAELAHALRGVRTMIFDGVELECSSEPDFDMADKFMRGGHRPDVPPSNDIDEPNLVNKTYCCGNDERYITSTPDFYRRVALGEQGGTIAFIRPGVAWTSAHIVYDTANNTWKKVNRNNVSPLDWPYYRRDEVHLDTTPEVHGCYHVTIPGCWADSTTNSNPDCDYAVIDFTEDGGGTPCSENTSSSWYGTSTSFAAASDGQISWGPGYPAYVNLSGGSINSGLSFVYTRLNSTWGSGTIIDGDVYATLDPVDVSGVRLYHEIDSTQGDSGRPTVRYSSGVGYYLIGNHVGYHTGQLKNVDRLWNSTTYDFAVAHSVYPN